MHRGNDSTRLQQREKMGEGTLLGKKTIESSPKSPGHVSGGGMAGDTGDKRPTNVHGEPMDYGPNEGDEHHDQMGERDQGRRVRLWSAVEEALQALDDTCDSARIHEGEDRATQRTVRVQHLQGETKRKTYEGSDHGEGIKKEADRHDGGQRRRVEEQGAVEAGEAGGTVHDGSVPEDQSWVTLLRRAYGIDPGSHPCVYRTDYWRRRSGQTHLCDCCNHGDTKNKTRKTKAGQTARQGAPARGHNSTAPSGAAKAARRSTRLAPRHLLGLMECTVEIPPMPKGAPPLGGNCATRG